MKPRKSQNAPFSHPWFRGRGGGGGGTNYPSILSKIVVVKSLVTWYMLKRTTRRKSRNTTWQIAYVTMHPTTRSVFKETRRKLNTRFEVDWWTKVIKYSQCRSMPFYCWRVFHKRNRHCNQLWRVHFRGINHFQNKLAISLNDSDNRANMSKICPKILEIPFSLVQLPISLKNLTLIPQFCQTKLSSCHYNFTLANVWEKTYVLNKRWRS